MDEDLLALRERSARLRREALSLLGGGAREVLEAALGPIEVAGSVALDLMVWPDIDLYARVESADHARMVAVAPLLAAQLERQGYPIARLAFRDEHRLRDPAFPDAPGLFLGVETTGPHGGRWTIDLWGWDGAGHAGQREQHARLRRELEHADRDLVLRVKEWARSRPGYRSMDVYAFATANTGTSVGDFERFRSSVRAQGQ
jgi:hypothetical protein